MRKDRESSADRVWKEKLCEFALLEDSLVLLSLVGVVLLVLVIIG